MKPLLEYSYRVAERARRTTGTIESQFADHAAKMKLLAQMVEAQPRPSDAAGPWLGPSE